MSALNSLCLYKNWAYTYYYALTTYDMFEQIIFFKKKRKYSQYNALNLYVYIKLDSYILFALTAYDMPE